MMTPEQLKNSILQLAIEGKLVPQIESEGTGAELLEKIKKSSLIEGKKLAKSKHNASQLGEVANEVSRRGFSFAIPKTWAWCRLGEIVDVNGGYAFKSSNYNTKGVRIIRISDFNENGFVDADIVRYKYSDELIPYFLKVYDILLCMTGGTVGKKYFVKYLPEKMAVNQRVATIRVKLGLPEYVDIVIASSLIQKIIQKSKNSINDNISMDTIKNFPIPLPPLAEQKRIVAKLEELLPLVEEYAQAYNKLQTLNTKFPADLKKSLLQYAMEGKLVPCDLSKWKQVKLGDVCDVVMGQSPEGNSVGEHCEGIEFHQGKIYFGENSLLPSPLKTSKPTKIAESGSLLLCVRAPVGVVNITERKICIGRGLCSINPKWDAPNEFMLYWMRCLTKYFEQQATGTTFKAISNTIIKNTVIPLPPLAEQKRIVAKLEELLPLCEELKGGK